MFYKVYGKVVKLFHDCSTTVSKAKCKATHEEGIEISAPKQMPQRLPIALTQVKAGNTAENLLNEIRQVIYSFYQEKKPLKKNITI